MGSLSIVHYPHPALRTKSNPVTAIDNRLRQTVREMFELMYAANGIGLAANQVGLPWRLFVINPTGDAEQTGEEHVFLNPEIIKRRGSMEGEEGCLSLPELYGPVRRAAEITIEAFDLRGQPFRMDLEDFPARVVQHEYDHIDGILFVDRMDRPAARGVRGRPGDLRRHVPPRPSGGGHRRRPPRSPDQLHQLQPPAA